MYLTRSEYDRGVNTFSPEGRLFQVEYAIEAVKLGSTAVGIQTSAGIILAVEKRLTSTLLEPSSVEKIMEVDFHIGAAVSGLIGGTGRGPARFPSMSSALPRTAFSSSLQMRGRSWIMRVWKRRVTSSRTTR
jgi:Proteasome subunit A N-terminal signature/Proteasome subunit